MEKMNTCKQAKSSYGNSAAKIFLIGFNKCGTSSFHRLFQKSGIPSVHWKTSEQEFIAPRMFANVSMGSDILNGLSHFQAFSDIFFLDKKIYLEANCLFPQIHHQYPDALFILNTRDRGRWLASRLNHTNAQNGSFVSRMERLLGVDERELVDLWSQQWDHHHHAVRSYFSHNPNFFEFNIEQHNPNLLADFLGSKGLAIDPNEWRKHNMTAPRSPIAQSPISWPEGDGIPQFSILDVRWIHHQTQTRCGNWRDRHLGPGL